MADSEWLHFSAQPPKRKRAELVCFACHTKKIKCDLQPRTRQGFEECSNCHLSARDCRLRPSKRDKRRRTTRQHEVSFDISADQNKPSNVQGPNRIHSSSEAHELLPPEPALPALDIDDVVVTSTAPIIDPQLTRPCYSPSSLNGSRAADFPSIFPSRFGEHNAAMGGDSVHSPARRSQASTEHTETSQTQLGDVDTGFLQVYGPENQHDADNQTLVARLEHKYHLDSLQPDLLQIFAETYWEYCYTWCPILDRETFSGEIARSPLLANALALAGSHVQPPLVPHDGPSEYYKKARTIFYDDEEADGLTALKAVSLFYWWAPRAPTVVHRHSSWWWTSVLIRHAQQMNIHREPSPDHRLREKFDLGLRRRIWWTAFARERLTALCQSKPCIIDPEDCNIQEPSLADFPADPDEQRKGEIFIHWVKLCAIIGRIAKILSRSSEKTLSSPFPVHLRQELIDWVQSLPPHLQLPIHSTRTQPFNRDVHQLHLPYLTVIIILHLKRSHHALPQALPPAILAASCTARILRDILSRGNTRFLMAITCWYCGTAFLALLQACRIEHLSKDANEDMDVLDSAVKQLQSMWSSANVIKQGFDRLRASNNVASAGNVTSGHEHSTNIARAGPASPGDTSGLRDASFLSNDEGFDWMAFFPFLSSSTSGLAEKLLSGRADGTATRGFPSPNNELFHETIMVQYQDLFEPFTDYALNLPDLTFDP